MAELRLDLDSHLQYGLFDSDLADICIDHDGEWDINLFKELENLSDAEELLQEFEFTPPNETTLQQEVNDINLLQWRSFASGDTDGCCTDVGVPGSSLSSGSAVSDTSSLSPLSLKQEDDVSMQPLPTMLSPEKKIHKRVSPPPRAKRPAHPNQRVSIQPKLPPSVLLTQPLAPLLKTRTIVIQPVGLQTVVSVIKDPPHVTVHATVPSTAAVPTMHLQPRLLIGPQIASPAPPLLAVTNQVFTMPIVPHHVTMETTAVSGPTHPMAMTYHNTAVDTEVCVERRQQRMVKNRESALLSRLRRKEALQALEARLRGALCENQRLLVENGSLRTQLDGLLTENTVLKVTAPKRRAVCLMVILVFFVLNTGPLRMWESEPSSSSLSTGTPQSSRHLLSFSPDQQQRSREETPAPQSPLEPMDAQYPQSHQSQDRWEDYAPEEMASHSPVSRTKSLRLAQNLRGWVHRHEEERTKSTRSTTDQSRHTTTEQHTTKTVLKSPERPQMTQSSNQVVTVSYSDRPGSEVLVYYSHHQSYSDFFDELNRRGDTFYMVSFRRDHLLLPATNHSKGRRPKMSLLLPAINVNDSVIKDDKFEVMMQIDCEVMDTKILHIKTSSIPEFLRANTTDFQAAASVGVLSDSA
ncbi:cyclic AMP-dependent transcription factor ATF-6 alpha isoform X1 [Oncorhynchus tshawytscha]|uniref:cyclic AMP-dependent transcription factor ATF-6 alpha isoform X1 n=2 Tax=Oncorhynchus tshawytscha TaxID=74940 RepID=UPI000D0A11A2|nr:cyclic AMP-dependent transcription factor ATF-6 alpha isoform X1 [Oncorhynchus tshawytscha]